MSIFLQIPNVTGESTTDGFIGQFEAASLLWGGVDTLIAGVKRTFTTGFTGVNVSKNATINSPTLMLLMVTKKIIGSVVVTIVKQVNGKLLPTHVYTLSNAQLTSFSQSANGQIPSEDMTFIFSRLTYQQVYYNNLGVKTGDETHYYDVSAKMGA